MLTIIITMLLTLFVVMIAMNFHTPEKTIAHEVERLFGIDDPQFRREMSALLGPAIVSGNEITPLANGEEIFPAMLAAIRAARSTITFETYIYWSGTVGKEFAEALMERARADVKVHVMLDWLGSAKIDAGLLQQMRDSGIEIERYHPLRWYSLGRMNNRTHRKVLVIDGAIGFTGGVGIADQWSGHAQDPQHWRDMHFRVAGPVVAQMQAAFLDNWIKTTGCVLHGAAYFPELPACGRRDMHLFVSSPAGGSASMRLMYLAAIAAATLSIDIEASYFVPDALMSGALCAARHRGVSVRVLLPGRHIDSESVRVASRRAWGPLLECGVEIHEYEPTMFHCKMLIFDCRMVSVGSTNFDMRSFELNDEASLNVYDAAFASDMSRVFESDIARSTPYDHAMWKQRPLWQRISEIIILPLKSQL